MNPISRVSTEPSTVQSVTGTARYDPWGTATSVTGSVPDFRFQGSWADGATGLSWAATRWYAPAQGRFISEDSLLGEPRDPDSRHLYAYGAGEPVGRWDPDGRFWYKVRAGDTLGMIIPTWTWTSTSSGRAKSHVLTREHLTTIVITQWLMTPLPSSKVG